MTVYKRRITSLIIGIIVAFFTGLVAYFVTGFFTENEVIVRGVSAGLALILLYIAMFHENIRFELEANELRYYQKGKLRQTFALTGCLARYHIKSERSFPPSHDITLYLTDTQDESLPEVYIDCSPLGLRQFERLFEQIEQNMHTVIPQLEVRK